MLRYSKPGDWVLDQFSGSGTTLVEAKLLNRNAIGVDVNPKSVDLSKENLDFECETSSRIVVRNGDGDGDGHTGSGGLWDDEDFED